VHLCIYVYMATCRNLCAKGSEAPAQEELLCRRREGQELSNGHVS